jgi:hypothetical protein
LNEAAAKIVEERKTRRDPKDTDGMRFDDWASHRSPTIAWPRARYA